MGVNLKQQIEIVNLDLFKVCPSFILKLSEYLSGIFLDSYLRISPDTRIYLCRVFGFLFIRFINHLI